MYLFKTFDAVNVPIIKMGKNFCLRLCFYFFLFFYATSSTEVNVDQIGLSVI